MLVFVYNEHRRPEAMQGEHDDLVMSLAIAHYIRGQQEVLARVKEAEGNVWTADMWDDYLHASASDKKISHQQMGQTEGEVLMEKLRVWQERFNRNMAAYSSEEALMDRRESLYKGQREITPLVDNDYDSPAEYFEATHVKHRGGKH